jgi:ubiquitin carboxyl-terminal hydrolase 4/11/15
MNGIALIIPQTFMIIPNVALWARWTLSFNEYISTRKQPDIHLYLHSDHCSSVSEVSREYDQPIAHKKPTRSNMLGGPTPTLTLKRPRSTSQPPSPNSTSSPKRAASEDPFASSSDIAAGSAHLPDANGNGYLNTMSAGQQGNSPLRSDVDGEGGSLVDRTEEVSLVDGEGMDGVVEERNGNSALREQYNMLLGELWDLSATVNALPIRQADHRPGGIPPPFVPYSRYYLLPKNILTAISKLALGGASREDGEGTEVKLAATSLVQEGDEGEEIAVVTSEVGEDGKLELVVPKTVITEKLWRLKAGLEEDTDFVYITEETWKKLAEW